MSSNALSSSMLAVEAAAGAAGAAGADAAQTFAWTRDRRIVLESMSQWGQRR